MRIKEKINNIVHKVHKSCFYERCYSDMEYQGIAVFECCCGIVGGTSTTEYLSEQCVSCPYLTIVKK